MARVRKKRSGASLFIRGGKDLHVKRRDARPKNEKAEELSREESLALIEDRLERHKRRFGANSPSYKRGVKLLEEIRSPKRTSPRNKRGRPKKVSEVKPRVVEKKAKPRKPKRKVWPKIDQPDPPVRDVFMAPVVHPDSPWFTAEEILSMRRSFMGMVVEECRRRQT